MDPDARLVRDRATLRRIRSLVIPPAWTNVWISSDPSSHVQAAGRDARQHENRSRNRWRLREESARRCCAPARDDIYPGWATMSTRARRLVWIDNAESRHVTIFGCKMRFHFRGKSDQVHDIALKDSRLARVVRHCQCIPGGLRVVPICRRYGSAQQHSFRRRE